ncbi:MAG: type II methionyl aminopeptidase [Candidatus Pacearchaeota archaeon]
MKKQDLESLRKAGKILAETRKYSKTFIKKDIKLLDIAEKIEKKIEELGGKPAFPTNLCINEIAAHYTPSYNDETKAEGLLKVDIGVHIDGFTADSAFSLDLENNPENKDLIKTAENCLNSAIDSVKAGKTLREIGKSIQGQAEKAGFSPIKNLSGHEISQYDLHSGVTIPNYDNGNPKILEDGSYAIEPFVTAGMGEVYEGRPSGIYKLTNIKNVRDAKTREILAFIIKEYKTLPFCSRWLVKKFGVRTLIELSILEKEGVIYNFPQLIEKSKMPVAQAEHTLIVSKGKVEVTTG